MSSIDPTGWNHPDASPLQNPHTHPTHRTRNPMLDNENNQTTQLLTHNPTTPDTTHKTP